MLNAASSTGCIGYCRQGYEWRYRHDQSQNTSYHFFLHKIYLSCNLYSYHSNFSLMQYSIAAACCYQPPFLPLPGDSDSAQTPGYFKIFHYVRKFIKLIIDYTLKGMSRKKSETAEDFMPAVLCRNNHFKACRSSGILP